METDLRAHAEFLKVMKAMEPELEADRVELLARVTADLDAALLNPDDQEDAESAE